METDDGRVLVPMLSQNTGMGYLEGTMKREIGNSVSADDVKHMIEECNSRLHGKGGILRYDIFGGRVHPSIRSVIVPSWDKTYGLATIVVPESIANNLSVPSIGSGGAIVYSRLNSGDWALVVRHPCISLRSQQPMRVLVKDVKCIGFPVWFCKQYNADFDGDEVHIFPLTSKVALMECGLWKHNVEGSLESLDTMVNHKGYHDMETTTLPVDYDILKVETPLSKMHTRCGIKEHCLNLMKEEWRDFGYSGYKMELKEGRHEACLEGMKQIALQQLTQGPVGRSSIVVKHTSCPGYQGDWMTDHPGGMRLLNTLASRLQQAKLNVHKAGSVSSSTDPVALMMMSSKYTMVITRGRKGIDNSEYKLSIMNNKYTVSLTKWPVPYGNRNVIASSGIGDIAIARRNNNDLLEGYAVMVRLACVYHGISASTEDVKLAAKAMAYAASNGGALSATS
jgi:hypothetical protein